MTERPNRSLPELPSELIDHILSYLSAVDLASVCRVSRSMYEHAAADHLWQAIVQAHVPGARLTSSYPCDSFRELYAAHDPRWYLTKYKIWFCDHNLAGKMVIVRYDQRRGVIEGYQLLATTPETPTQHTSSPSLVDGDAELEIHSFQPEVKLHLDKPILQLRANSLENTIRAAARRSSNPSVPVAKSFSVSTSVAPLIGTGNSPKVLNRLGAETPMPLDDRFSDTMLSTFMLARGLSASHPLIEERCRQSFPYGNVWPPPTIPAGERVLSGDLVTHDDRPTERSEISERAFRIRSWIETRPAGLRNTSLGWLGHGASEEWPLDSSNNPFGQASRPWLPNYLGVTGSGIGLNGASVSAHIGESVTTYSTLDPDLYTPTPDQPWKGIWVGDYSSHGCEFLLMKQSHTTPFDDAAFDATRMPCETASEFAQRKMDARKYRGRLEAIKLTGDPNVPRGECTFVAEDLGDQGYVTTVEEQPFLGTRVVRSKGHIARPGFTHGKSSRARPCVLVRMPIRKTVLTAMTRVDRYIQSQLLLISENRLAQFWLGYNHISFFDRVDIDQFLVPN